MFFAFIPVLSFGSLNNLHWETKKPLQGRLARFGSCSIFVCSKWLLRKSDFMIKTATLSASWAVNFLWRAFRNEVLSGTLKDTRVHPRSTAALRKKGQNECLCSGDEKFTCFLGFTSLHIKSRCLLMPARYLQLIEKLLLKAEKGFEKKDVVW